jgi:hypothetical protein
MSKIISELKSALPVWASLIWVSVPQKKKSQFNSHLWCQISSHTHWFPGSCSHSSGHTLQETQEIRELKRPQISELLHNDMGGMCRAIDDIQGTMYQDRDLRLRITLFPVCEMFYNKE